MSPGREVGPRGAGRATRGHPQNRTAKVGVLERETRRRCLALFRLESWNFRAACSNWSTQCKFCFINSGNT